MEAAAKVDEARETPAGPGSRRILVITAWAVMLLASTLPVVIFKEFMGMDTGWMLWARLALLAVLAAAATFVTPIRPLRSFFLILLGVYLFEWLVFDGLGKTAVWTGWFGIGNAPFATDMLGSQILRLAVALGMIALLLLLRYRRQRFFLTMGNLRAPIEPVRFLGFPNPEPWARFGGQWAVYISLGTLTFLLVAGHPALSILLQVLPLLPLILLFAAMNAFNEEMTYRASFLATLESVVGPRQALLISALFFGIGHYYGVPYGVIGVILASLLGMMLGKAMLETRGFFLAWFIHFLQDVAIFIFIAAGSITPGGG